MMGVFLFMLADDYCRCYSNLILYRQLKVVNILQDNIMPSAELLMREVRRRELAIEGAQRYAEACLGAWAKAQIDSYQSGEQSYATCFNSATADALVCLFNLADLSYLCAQIQTALNEAWADFRHEDVKSSVFPRCVIVDYVYESPRGMMSAIISFPAQTSYSVG
ncbi:MAG: hypothetical protein ACHQTE_02155 [Candidatus Saccharimonadales bacterium]